jgi:site-specific recombinase XerD
MGTFHLSWEEAVRGFYTHKRAVKAHSTAIWYLRYATQLKKWAEANNLSIDSFTKRNLDEYLVFRKEAGKSETTIHHDALVATVLTEWCKHNSLIDRDSLAEYKVTAPPEPHKYMPTADDVQKLLQGFLDYYDATRNPKAKYIPPGQRTFHRTRNYAIEIVKIDTACRIGEIFAFKVGDYQQEGKDKQLTVRKAKGKKGRVLPVSKEGAVAIDAWLKVRERIMSEVPDEDDEGWLFISETGAPIRSANYLRSIHHVLAYAGLPEGINNHSQRRFSINMMAEQGGVVFAQNMAGHKDPKTTQIYQKLSPGYLRQQQEHVGVVRGVLVSNRADKKKRLNLKK